MSNSNWWVGRTLALFVLIACGGGGSDSPGIEDGNSSGGSATTTVDQGNTEPGDTVTTGSAGDDQALEIGLMAAADLPSDLPVPVPAGGEINPNLSVSEGQSLVVDYPPGMFDAVAAFYDAWFAEQGVPVEPTFGSSDSRRWRVQIDGMNIEVGLSPASDQEGDTLFILYP